MPLVHLPTPLRDLADGISPVRVEGSTVRAALGDLVDRHPRLRRHLFDDAGRLRGFVNVFLDEQDVKDMKKGMETPVGTDDALTIVPSVAGGDGALSNAERGRYARHLALPEFGLEGQMRLRAARIAIVGAGGLGSPVSLYLAAAGVGTLGLIDFDTVDLTNLQRQVLYGVSDLGRPKTEAAAERLHDANPHVEIVRHEGRLTRDNALDVLEAYDIVVDGTDNFQTRYLVNDACVLLGKPYVYGSILRFDGQVSVFAMKGGPCYRCLFREPPPPGLVPNCAEGGVLGVLPGLIGSAQALEAIKLATGVGETLNGRLALFDGLAFRWRELRIRRSPDCPVCGDSPTLTGLIDYDEFCGVGETKMPGIPEITAAELQQRIDTGEPLQLIDVREPFEWDIANLGPQGAKLVPMGEISGRVEELDRDTDLVVYCRSGARSGNVVRYLQGQGFERIWNLKDGILGWGRDLDPEMASY